MKTKVSCTVAGVLIAFIATGCNVGNQPQGASVDEIKKTLAAKPAQEQIDLIQHSPMPAAEKATKIAEIKNKYHITSEDPKPEPGRPGG